MRERVLVDVQGDDVLLQIFTRPILRAPPNEEAPFLEFIQRVCSARELPRPGCGGFGIRNFLVLFLSSELAQRAAARRRGVVLATEAARGVELDPADIADAAAREADLRAAGARRRPRRVTAGRRLHPLRAHAAAMAAPRWSLPFVFFYVSARYAAAMKTARQGERVLLSTFLPPASAKPRNPR